VVEDTPILAAAMTLNGMMVVALRYFSEFGKPV